MKQHTLRTACRFSGTGLHGGQPVSVVILPAPDDYGIRFHRTDLGPDALLPARLEYVGRSRRSTLLQRDPVKVVTPEHLLSALAGMGVDNALIRLDAPELPILDGSAGPYADAFRSCGLVPQTTERRVLVVEKPFVYEDAAGTRIAIEPSDSPSFEVTVDFKSAVLGVQTARFDASVDYADEIAPCRTFCFYHEVGMLLRLGLIKGGTLDNALVIDEPRGYLGGKTPYFDNEVARHKLLDLIGDFSLLGCPLQGRVVAFKPGHKANARALKQFLESTK